MRFIHIPKSAGSSIESVIRSEGLAHDIGHNQSDLADHLPVASFVYSDQAWCVIRHPLDRVVSHYKHARRTEGWNCTWPQFIADMDVPLPPGVSSPWIPQTWWLCDHASPWSLRDWQAYHQSAWHWRGTRPSWHQRLVDHVIDMHQPGWQHRVMTWLGCGGDLPWANQSPGAPWHQWYTVEQAWSVYNRLTVDFEQLGYTPPESI